MFLLFMSTTGFPPCCPSLHVSTRAVTPCAWEAAAGPGSRPSRPCQAMGLIKPDPHPGLACPCLHGGAPSSWRGWWDRPSLLIHLKCIIWYNHLFSTSSSNFPSCCELWGILFASDCWCRLYGFILEIVSFSCMFFHIAITVII